MSPFQMVLEPKCQKCSYETEPEKVFVVSNSPQMSGKVKQDYIKSLDSWLA